MNCNYKYLFKLDDAEYQTVQNCIETYSQKTSLRYIINLIFNAVKHIFGKSDWQKAEIILISKNPLTLTEQKNRHSVQFMLRYLTSSNNRAFISKNDIAQIEIISSKSSPVFPFEEILIKASYGNGKQLPVTLDRSELETDIIAEVKRCEERITELKTLLSCQDPRFAITQQGSKKTAEERIQMANIVLKNKNSLNEQDKKEEIVKLLEYLIELRKQYRKISLSIAVFRPIHACIDE